MGVATRIATLALAAGGSGCAGLTGPFDPGSPRALAAADAEPSYATANLIGAERELDQIESGLGDTAEYDVLGLEGVVLPWPMLPIGLELGAGYGESSTSLDLGPPFGAVDVELEALSVNAGLRLYLHRALPGGFPVEPFVAAGVARLYADIDVAGLGFADAPTGHYLRAGVQFRVTGWLHVGLDWRRLADASSSVAVAGGQSATIDFDSDQLGLFLGLRL